MNTPKEIRSFVAFAQKAGFNVRPGAKCMLPIAGWDCTRTYGHKGPCAARPTGRCDFTTREHGVGLICTRALGHAGPCELVLADDLLAVLRANDARRWVRDELAPVEVCRPRECSDHSVTLVLIAGGVLVVLGLAIGVALGVAIDVFAHSM